jgi:hypothetical protein
MVVAWRGWRRAAAARNTVGTWKKKSKMEEDNQDTTPILNRSEWNRTGWMEELYASVGPLVHGSDKY